MTELRATYRLQLGGDFGFAAARELVPYLADLGVSHLYLPPSFQARDGLDARLRRGRPDLDLERARRRGGVLRAGATRRRTAGLGIVLDIVPNHMATDDAEPLLERPGAAPEVLRHRRQDGPPPALLRHRPPRGGPPGGPGGVRGDAPARAAAGARGHVDGLRIDHPDGLADPAGYLRAAARGRRRARLGGEDPRPGRAAARLAGRRHRRLRVPQRRVRAVRRPRRRGAADRPVGRGLAATTGASASCAFEAKLEQARTTFAPEVERLLREAPGAGRRARARAGVAARLPHLRRAVVRARRRRGPRTPCAEAGLPASLASQLLLEVPGWEAFVTRFQQTTPPVMAKGVEDTAFYRYARLLALNDVGGDPGRFSVSVRDFHRGNAERRGALPAQPAGHPDARHQALGRRAGADRRAGRRCRTSSRRT